MSDEKMRMIVLGTRNTRVPLSWRFLLLGVIGMMLLGGLLMAGFFSYRDTIMLSQASQGNWGMVETLLEHGANPDAINPYGLMAIDFAVGRRGSTDALWILIRHGASLAPTIPDKFRRVRTGCYSPFATCVYLGNISMVKMFLDEQTKVTDEVMRFANNLEIFNALVRAGGHLQRYQLHKAASSHLDDTSLVEYLLDRGFDVNAQTEYGYTPLRCAAEAGNPRIAEYLLRHGARLDLKDTGGETPLDIAKENNQKEVVSVLEKYSHQ